MPKYEKIGVAIRGEQDCHGADGPDNYYLIFQVVQLDVEAPPDATSAGEVVVAGDDVEAPPDATSAGEVVVAGEIVRS